MNSICIYCHEQTKMSREHHLPECMGKFKDYAFLLEKVCEKCNGKFSPLEEQFCRCGPEALFRIFLNIQGRRYHTKPSPFYRGSAGGKRIEIKAKHPDMISEIYWELKPNTLTSMPARQIIIQKSDGEIIPFIIHDNINSAEDIEAELGQAGIKEFQIIEFWCKQDEKELFNSLLSKFNYNPTFNKITPYQDKDDILHEATIVVTDRYFRAIAKIAFHYFLTYFSQFTGNEPNFNMIKNYIMEGGKGRNYVKEIRGTFIEDLIFGGTTPTYNHFFSVEKDYHNIVAKLQFFVGPTISPQLYYEVFIGRNPEIIDYPQRIGHQFEYFDEPDAEGYEGRIVPMRPINKKLLPRIE